MLWQKNRMHCGIPAVHDPLDSEKYAATLCVLIQEFENRFQGYKKKKITIFWYICNSVFSQRKLTSNFQITIRHSTEIFAHVSSPDFRNTDLTREKRPSLHNYTLSTSSPFGDL